MLLSVFTCGLYVADTYARNANTVAGVTSSALVDAYTNTDFGVALAFAGLFFLRRCGGRTL